MNEELFFALLADVAVGFSSVFVSINFKRQNQYELHRTIHPTKVDTAMFVEILKKNKTTYNQQNKNFYAFLRVRSTRCLLVAQIQFVVVVYFIVILLFCMFRWCCD